jgi:hypothetical protein
MAMAFVSSTTIWASVMGRPPGVVTDPTMVPSSAFPTGKGNLGEESARTKLCARIIAVEKHLIRLVPTRYRTYA